MARPVRFEFRVPDPLKTAAFYEQALGWIFTRSEDEAGAWDITTGSRSSEGFDGRMATSDDAPATVLEITVPDIDTAVDRVTRIGGTVLARTQDGAYCADPSGMLFKLVASS